MKIDKNYKLTPILPNNINKTPTKNITNFFTDYLVETQLSNLVQKANIIDHNNIDSTSYLNLEQEDKKKCNQLLDMLRTMQISILQGNINSQDLSELKHLLYLTNNFTTCTTLKDILEEIELRAAVELAKLKQL
ncbi:flagellar assembly regulator FliX [Rickettsiales bacterium Ac37b]|nr:flagellar assembly regulator FliX [Rickettsiales bacterium Ac37b]